LLATGLALLRRLGKGDPESLFKEFDWTAGERISTAFSPTPSTACR